METTFVLRIPSELLAEAHALAASQDRPLAWVVRDLLRKAIAASKEKNNAQ